MRDSVPGHLEYDMVRLHSRRRHLRHPVNAYLKRVLEFIEHHPVARYVLPVALTSILDTASIFRGNYQLSFSDRSGIYGIKMFECVNLEEYEKNHDIFA